MESVAMDTPYLRIVFLLDTIIIFFQWPDIEPIPVSVQYPVTA